MNRYRVSFIPPYSRVFGQPYITIIKYFGNTASSKKKKSMNRSNEENTPNTLEARNIKNAKNSRGRSWTFQEISTPQNTTTPAINTRGVLIPSTPTWYEIPSAGTQGSCSRNW